MRLIDADALHDWLESYAKHGIDDHLRANAKQLMKHVDEQPTVLDTPTEEQFQAAKARIAELEADLARHIETALTTNEELYAKGERIAELEAENERLTEWVNKDAEIATANVKLSAELAALKGRSCETCEFAEGCDIEAAGHDDAAFTYCSVSEEWHLRYRAERGTE